MIFSRQIFMKKCSIVLLVLSVFFSIYLISSYDINANENNIGKVKILKVKSTKQGIVTIKWKKIKNLKFYQVQYSNNRKFKNKKTVRVKKQIN